MKTIIFIVVLGAASWWLLSWVQKKSAAKSPNAAERYATSLQNSVQRADAAREKADALIHQQEQAVRAAQKDSGDPSNQ